jgi:hypothetical protein
VLEDLAIEERLDAAIDRALQRFFRLKAASEIYPSNQPQRLAKPSMLIEGSHTVVE